MNISGIRTGAGFYDYNSIKINEVRNQQIRESMESGPIPVMGAVEQNDSAEHRSCTVTDSAERGSRSR